MTGEPFWRTKKLAQMNREEWESLCDGCGRCCLHKLEDEENGRLYWTNVACKLLDGDSCRCGDYVNRLQHVPDCIQLSAGMIDSLEWLPRTCGYRLVHEGHDLYWWHPLVSGDPETVHLAGVSVRGRIVSETDTAGYELEDFIVRWPGRVPKRALAKAG
jgi:uncharacterized cysteine cluster protein YcgN (CxxCxxCC family)